VSSSKTLHYIYKAKKGQTPSEYTTAGYQIQKKWKGLQPTKGKQRKETNNTHNPRAGNRPGFERPNPVLQKNLQT